MNEEAIKYGYELFKNDGYNGSIEEYKSLISEDREAFSHSYKLFRDDGYEDSMDDLESLLISKPQESGKTQAVSTESPLDSAQQVGDSGAQSVNQPSTSVSVEPEASDLDVDVNQDIVLLYDEYKKSGALPIGETNAIKKVIESQEKGDRSIWEKVEAYTEGWLKTGMPVPLYKYDTEESLKDKREYAKKSNFLEALPNEKREELNNYAVNRSLELSKASKNILAENKILEEKSKSLVKNTLSLKESIINAQKSGKVVPKAMLEEFKSRVDEIEDISVKYNSNIDTMESNNEDIGSFGEELDLLKRNYRGVGYYKDLARLTSADMISGLMEFAVSTAEMIPVNTVLGGGTLEFEESEKFISEFREETAKQRSEIKPTMSVSDIESGSDFGKWLAEQTAIQLPTITTLIASGGSNVGLGLLGATAAGSKMGELKDLPTAIKANIEGLQSQLDEMDSIIKDKQSTPVEGSKQGQGMFTTEDDMPLEEMVSKRDELFKKIEKLKAKPFYSKPEIYLAGIGNGLTEMLSEEVSLGILSKGRRTLKTVNKADLRTGISDYTSNFIKGGGVALYDAGKEGASEFANSLSQNLIDILYLGDDNTHVFDGTTDALASGMAMGFGMSFSPTAIGIGSKAFTDKNIQALMSENSNKIEGILSELETGRETLPESTKKLLVNKVEKLLKEQNDHLEKAFNRVTQMERGDIETLIKLDTKANKIMKGYKEIVASDMPASIKADLLKDLKKEADKIVEKKTEILEKTNGTKSKAATPKTETTTEATTETVTTETGTNKGGEGVNQTSGETSAQSSVVGNGKGVQQSGIRVEGTTPDGNVAGVRRDAKKWNWDNLDKQPISKIEAKLNELREDLSAISKKGKLTSKDIPSDMGSKIKALESQLAKNQEVAIAENRVDEVTVDNIPNINLSEKVGLDKLSSFLDDVDIALSESTKNTLGINLPVVVAQGAIKAMKLAVATAKTGADVISAGINYMRNTDWYKKLNDKDKQEAEKDFLKNVQSAKDENVQAKTIKQQLRSAAKTADLKTIFKKATSGFPLVTYIDSIVFEPAFNWLEANLAKGVNKALIGENETKRKIAQITTAWYNGLPRTNEQLFERRRVSGLQELAYIKGAKLTAQLQAIINGNPESARRVHAALDPEVYSKEDAVSYEELKDNEKLLFDELRKLNEKTHQANYEMGFISEETYEKYKGSYIGRGYETYENIEGRDLEERENFLSNKLFTDMFKQRKEIDEWKIENTVKDPIYLTINRMIHTERNAAVKAYSGFISRNADLVSKDEKPGFTKLTGKAYGDLNGKYVVNYIAEDFKGYFYDNYILDKFYLAFQAYDKNTLRQFYKKFHTVFSPAVQAGNFVSNHAFAAATGVNIISLWKNFSKASEEIKSQTGDYLTLVENRIIGADVLTQDLTLERSKQDKLKLGEKALKTIDKADKWAQGMYSKSDDVMKLSAFKALKESGYTEEEAIQRVFDGFQNYSTVGKMWDFASKTPLVGNTYIKFQADLQRIMKNAVGKRPLTTATMLAGIRLISYATSFYLAGEDDEARDIREGRSFIPKIPIGFTEVPLVFKITPEKEVNLARYISPFYNYDIPNEGWLAKITNFMPYQMKQIKSGSGEKSLYISKPDVLIGSVWAAFADNMDFRGKTITDPNANKYVPSGLTDVEKITNQINYVMRSQVPFWSLGSDVVSSVTEGEDFYGRDKSLFDVLLSIGIKIQTYDDDSYDKTIQSYVNTIDYTSKGIKDKMNGIKNRLEKDTEILQKRLDEGKIDEAQFEAAFKRKFKESLSRIESQTNKLAEQQSKLNLLIKKVNKYGEEKGGN